MGGGTGLSYRGITCVYLHLGCTKRLVREVQYGVDRGVGVPGVPGVYQGIYIYYYYIYPPNWVVYRPYPPLSQNHPKPYRMYQNTVR